MHTRTRPRAALAALGLSIIVMLGTPATAWGTRAAPPPDPAPDLTALVEWDILTSGAPYEVLILQWSAIGNIDRPVCGMYDPAGPTLTLYTDQMPRPPGGFCYPMLKAIRRVALGRWATALQQNPNSPYTLGLPGGVLPIAIQRDGPIVVTLPAQVKGH